MVNIAIFTGKTVCVYNGCAVRTTGKYCIFMGRLCVYTDGCAVRTSGGKYCHLHGEDCVCIQTVVQ